MTGSLLTALALLTSCASSPDTVVLSGDRQVIKQAEDGWRVSDVWMQERYQLERALRLRLERCEAEAHGAVSPVGQGAAAPVTHHGSRMTETQ